MEKQTTKLGARVLSKSELNAILPNAESVYEQIEVFRSNIPERNNEQKEMEQKTNNIGIMGCRGAGKTSILRTFYESLREKNANGKEEAGDGKSKSGDIILPIIVPENMSVGTTLMDVVLGMLKPIVGERKKEKAAWSEDCIYSGRGLLEKQYDELVKQYCYIKKDYRDILIQQFTTEQNYVDKTKEVFNSDSEFIKLFNQFVAKLLQGGANADSNAMIFLFIDDIDLSTIRCMDVVRTLLSYLSNPRIVTFISGDMETFEEALTLEFLRQEKALDAGVFKETYYSTNDALDKSRLLERKKLLAYEYLKKIVPPAYRRSIKYWSLEERGRYQISDGKGGGQKNLAELLVEVSEEKVKESYFVYREDDVQRHMELAFHMFDDTSRGLNNVYNVLQELSNSGQREGMAENRSMLSLWRLIETMADSKPLYAKYKAMLFKQIIVLEQEQVKVNFENAYNFLFGEDDRKKGTNEEKDKKKDGSEKKAEENVVETEAKRFSPKERFTLFFLIDFSTRLFSDGPKDDIDYKKLKNKIIQEYLGDETIDGKISSEKKLTYWLTEEDEKSFNSIQSIVAGFLKQGDFIFVLHFIRYLGRNEIYDILKNSKNRWYSEKETAYKIAYALAQAVWAINGTEESRKNYLADLYLQMPEIMLGLLGKLSLDQWMIYGRQLTDGVNKQKEDVSFMNDADAFMNDVNAFVNDANAFMNDANDLANYSYWNMEYISLSKMQEQGKKERYLLWVEHENKNLIYWIYYEDRLREKKEGRDPFDIKSKAMNSIFAGLTKTIMVQMQEVMTKYEVRGLGEFGYDTLSDERAESLKRKVIIEIDKQGLWKRKYAEDKVYSYLNNERERLVLKMSCGRAVFDATKFLAGAYSELKNCEKGSSGKALIYNLFSKVQDILFLHVNGELHEESRFSDGKYYLRLEQTLIIQCLLEEFLKLHGRIRYGKKEARQLLMEIKELPLVLHSPEWNVIHKELEAKEDKFFKECKVKIEGGSMYSKYLEQGRRIKSMLCTLNETEGKMLKWDDIEPVISKKDYMFIFHSYLRYLQANNDDAKKAGVQAEVIATLAKYMLDGEIIADQKIQNEIYEIISKEIEMTEEEFETLF